MNWQEACEHPSLQDLPFKIELNSQGQLIMSPTRLLHSALQIQIIFLLRDLLPNGKILPEVAIKTAGGTRVADVGWFSLERWHKVKNDFDAAIAPEICVEILSPTNSALEMEQKKVWYFAAGAEECWICNEAGEMQFFSPIQKLEHSRLVHDFPLLIQP